MFGGWDALNPQRRAKALRLSQGEKERWATRRRDGDRSRGRRTDCGRLRAAIGPRLLLGGCLPPPGASPSGAPMAAAVVGVAPPADVFEQSSLFKGLPAAFLTELRAHLRQRSVTTGSVIVREGEPGDCYYLIVSGEAEAWVLRGGLARAGDAPPAASGGTPHEADAQGGLAGDAEAGSPSAVEQWEPDSKRYALAERLGPGDGFGEAAVLLGAQQPATVRAATDLVLYTLDGPTFLRLAHERHGLEAALHEEMVLRAVGDFLGEASPFACLPPEALRWLATRLQVVSFQPGEAIVR